MAAYTTENGRMRQVADTAPADGAVTQRVFAATIEAPNKLIGWMAECCIADNDGLDDRGRPNAHGLKHARSETNCRVVRAARAALISDTLPDDS